jgi:predicted Zn-dependent peptidase
MILTLLCAFAGAVPAAGDDEIVLPTHKKVLANGMTVILAPDRQTPLVAVRLFYKVGSRNEHEGITGTAHLFEHMMFNGARRYGPKRFDAVLEAAGGAGNAQTTHDYTVYTTQVPPAALPVVFDLEADRMVGLDVSKHILAREIQVVLEERRQNLEDSPVAMLQSVFLTQLFQASPYRWPILGWASDVRKATVARCVGFYETYYAPNNAVLVLAGDLDVDATFAAVERAFGALPHGPEIPKVVTEEPERLFASRCELRRVAPNGTVLIGVIGPRAQDPEHPVLDLAQQLLANGLEARLYKRLVLRSRLATAVGFGHAVLQDKEPLTISIALAPGKDARAAEDAAFSELQTLCDAGVTAEELERARAGCTANLLHNLATLGSRATLLGEQEVACGDHRRLVELPRLWAAVTPAQVAAALRKYFVRERAAVAVLVPEAAR